MKSRFLIALAMLGAAMLWCSGTSGQMAPTPLLKVDVPFEFVAGGMNLPAGSYDVLHIMNPNWILLRSSDGRAIAVLSVQVSSSSAKASSTRLVFNQYGQKYFLAQVWTENDNQVHTCFKSSAERVLASRSQRPPQVATVYPKP
ncbi:MAG TPA: hypothetical protein VEV41_25640 [Terriglobales bacterium]|nr:hypothetical protein [Terriglobales bacterium]